MRLLKAETAAYVKEQVAKGTPAAVADGDAVEINNDAGLVRPQTIELERRAFRPGNRLAGKKVTAGRWGEGGLTTDLHGSGVAGTAPEFGPLLHTALGGKGTNAAGTVADAAATTTEFDSALDLEVGQAVKVDIAGTDEIRVIATKSGAGPYTYTVTRAFSQAPADTAAIRAGVSYFITADATLLAATPWLTVDQYEHNARYLATDARARGFSLSAEAGELIGLAFELQSIGCQESDASDPNTPSWDDQASLPFLNCTLEVDGTSTNIKGLEASTSVPRVTRYANDNGISDLPVNTAIEATGSFSPEMTDTAEVTAFMSGTLADLTMTAGTQAGNIAYLEAADIQYGNPASEDDEGELAWAIPYTITGGLTVAFF